MRLIEKYQKLSSLAILLASLCLMTGELFAAPYGYPTGDPSVWAGEAINSGETLNFNSNVLGVPFAITANSGSTVSFTGGDYLVTQPLDTFLEGTLAIENDTFVQDSGTFTLVNTITISDANGAFTNRATLLTGALGGISVSGVGTFVNEGNATFSSGTTISSNVSNTGNFSISIGSFSFNTRTFDHLSGGVLVGSFGSVASFGGSGTVENSSSFIVGNQGTLGGTGAVNNNSQLSVISGGAYTRTGVLTNTGQLDITGGTVTFQSTLDSSGSINISSSATVTFPAGAYTGITGTVSISGSNTITNDILGSGSATLTFSSATGTYTNTIDFPNISVTGATTPTLSGTSITSSTFTVNSGAAVAFSGVTTFSGGTVSNSGTFTSGIATLTTSGTFTNDNTLSITGGTFSPDTFTNTSSATFSGSSVFDPDQTSSNTGTITFSGTSAINGSITNSASGQIVSSGTSHVIGSNVTLTNGNSNSVIDINVSTTLTDNTSIIQNTLGTLSVDGTLTNGTINNLDIMTVTANIAGTGTLTNSGSLTHTSGTLSKSTVSNTGQIIVNGGTISSTGITNNAAGTIEFNAGTMSGTISNFGTITFDNGSVLSGTITAQEGSSIYLNASVTLTGSTIVGASSTTASELIINQNSTGTQSTATAIDNITTITVAGGTFAVLSGDPITDVNTEFTVASGATATFAAGLSGTGVIENSGTMTFNSGSSISSFSSLNMYSGSTTNISSTGTFTLTTTPIQGQGDTAVGTLSISNSTNLSIATDAFIDLISSITVATGSTLTVGTTVTNFNSLSLGNGSLVISSTGFLTVDDNHTITGSGNITNNGSLTVDNASLTSGGAFTNSSTGNLVLLGTPTLTFSGSSFTNEGTIFAQFNTSNDLPFINCSGISGAVTISSGTIIIGYNNNYIAGGDYTLLTSNAAVTIGGYALPQPSRYISAWALTASGPNVNVTVTRDGFGNHALTPRAVEIGNFMEQIGSGSPTQAQIDLLNALEAIETDDELTAELLSLLPADSAPLQTLEMISQSLRPVEMRLPMLRNPILAYAAGDASWGQHGLWIRPFSSSGHQFGNESLAGYRARTNGLAFGFDVEALSWVTLGIAGSMSKSTVTQDDNSNTFTNISNYQGMIYGTLKYPYDSYLDWIIAIGNNNYNSTRNIPLIETDAVATYAGQQFTAKAMASKQFIMWEYYLFEPFSSAQYSFVRNSNYEENGAGPWNTSVTQDNMNLLRLGVGGDFSVPFDVKNSTSIPAVHAGIFVDAIGGAQDSNVMFISGGPIITSSVSQSRLMILLGASLTVSITDHLELMANYDYEIRRNYNAHEAFLNLRYKF